MLPWRFKPEERRRFFEEAAGIGLYRGRREEALNRLDTTRRNLERVLDILSELEPRLGSLEKQARRARITSASAPTCACCCAIGMVITGTAAAGAVHAREVLHAQGGRLELPASATARSGSQLGDLRATLHLSQCARPAWHARSSELHTQWEKVSRNLAVMEERQRALVQQQQNLQTDLNRLEEEQKAAPGTPARPDRRARPAADGAGRCAGPGGSARKKLLEKRQAERGRVEQTLRDTRRTLVQSETAQVQLKAHQNELTNRVEALRKNKQAFRKPGQ
jgi:chromosome segregation protein